MASCTSQRLLKRGLFQVYRPSTSLSFARYHASTATPCGCASCCVVQNSSMSPLQTFTWNNRMTTRGLPSRFFSSDANNDQEANKGSADSIQQQQQQEEDKEFEIPGAQSGKRKLAIIFTCTVCETRSIKQFSETAYEKGVVLARCPGCQNIHLIADRLGYFEDESYQNGQWDIQKAMSKMGDDVKVIRDENVLEFTFENVVGQEKLEEIRASSSSSEAAVDEPHTTTNDHKI